MPIMDTRGLNLSVPIRGILKESSRMGKSFISSSPAFSSSAALTGGSPLSDMVVAGISRLLEPNSRQE